jgi:hypothetical protein
MKKYISILASLLLLAATSCIQETVPGENFVTDDQLASSEIGVKGLMNAVYTTLASVNPFGDGQMSYGAMKQMLDHGTSSLLNPGYNGFNTMLQYSYGNFSYANRSRWPVYLYYTYIRAVNDIIGLYPEDAVLTDTQKGYVGQCYAFRALFYMEIVQIMEWKKPTDAVIAPKLTAPKNDLTNLGVPIITDKTTGAEASNNPRPTVDENYDLILADLAKAEELLKDFVRTDKIQPDLGVVYGLYARAYLNLATRAKKLAAKYTDEADLWNKCYSYAQKAIETSGCTPLTEEQWMDPVNGFNNRNSQNSWMLAYNVSENNAAAITTDWNPANTFGTETNYIVYGWRVGRGLARHWYERLSDNDWRKKSWLAPEFFYESTNQVPGGKYLVEKDASGNLINNKWAKGSNSSNVQEDWSDDYDGTGTHSYRLTSSPSWIRSRINKYYGFQGWPWLYVNIKFRPHNGAYNVYTTGGATDYPCMRVEEMYFIKAEALAHSQSLGAGKAALEEIVKTRNSTYSCNASTLDAFIEEMYFQKGIEFWGEGVPYFDAKRLERGIHRAYLGTNLERYQHGFDIDGPYTGMTPGWNQAELNANPAIFDYNNPHTPQASLYVWAGNDDFRPYYGCEINTEGMKY